MPFDRHPIPRARSARGLFALALALAVLAGCDDSGGGDTPSTDAAVDAAPGCTPGAESCPCAADGTCGAGLTCELGFCVPDDGPPPCDPGAAGCVCVDGMCAAGLACAEGVCVTPGCDPGTADCNCDDGRCDDPLACVAGVCAMGEPPPQDALWVDGGDVRGCDILFEEGPVPVSRVRFADGLVAEWLRQDGKVAMAFVGPGGGPVRDVGAVILEGERVATAAELPPIEARCYDADGRPIAGATLHFD